MAEVHPFGSEPAEAECRTHAFAFLVAGAEIDQGLVSLRKEFCQNILEPRCQSRRPLLEKRREHPRDFLHSNTAGKFTRLRPAHPVANCKDEVGFDSACIADFSKMPDIMSINGKAQEGILIILPDPPSVRVPGPGDHGEGLC